MNNEKTGNLIAARRKAKGLTQDELAEQLHITGKAVSKWERGLSFPGIDLLEPLAQTLDLTVEEILSGEPAPAPSNVPSKPNHNIIRWLIPVSAAVFALLVVLHIWGPAIFQRGNPLPYLLAAVQLREKQPFVLVNDDDPAEIYISQKSTPPDILFSYVEQRWNVEFLEQAGSGYIFTNDKAHLVVSSEIYWGRYKLWFVPTATLEAS